MYVQQTLSQEIKLNLTPQLMQALDILQMPSVDLFDYVQEQMNENPFMEVDDLNFGVYRRKEVRSGVFHNNENQVDLLSLVCCPTETLEMSILSQLRINGISDRYDRIAQYLAGNLNDDGFLIVTLEEVCNDLNESLEEADAALKCLQSFEPAGIGARSLQECLQIQILRDAAPDVWAYSIVTYYINELASGKLQLIADALGILVGQVKASLQYIRTLNPRPGLAYKRQSAIFIEPDAYIVKDGDQYAIKINERSIPKVSINSNYHQLKQRLDEKLSKDATVFVKDKVQSVHSIIRCLRQRKLTMLRVIDAIVDEQVSFFDNGIAYLKPMNLNDIAGKLGLHKSTVSRTVRHKYVQTPQGIYELKYFFTTGLATAQGEAASAKSIKAKILELIKRENKGKTLSDQQITNILVEEGIQISRRTVMKYREELHVLSSRLRTKS